MNKVKTVIIPIAGYGSRMFPVTLGVAKAMLPISNKPVIQYLLEECALAGIEKVVIVMSSYQESVKDYLTLSNKAALEKFSDKEAIKELVALLNKFQFEFVIQESQKGLGDAILCGKKYVEEDFFAVILGDNPILCQDNDFGVAQLVKNFKLRPGYYIGTKKIRVDDANKYGMVSMCEDPNKEVYQLDGMVEKPKDAPPSLYAALGRYILGKSIFKYIEETTPGVGGEIQVTDAIVKAIDNEPVYGCTLNGECHDTGSIDGYFQATVSWKFIYQK